ncbi:Fc.00g099710.m01.CDS01 [Cosmosporella sp. VM-42]
MTNISRLFVAILTAILLQTSQAFGPAKDRQVCKEGLLCVTSFTWCNRYGADASPGCSFPENTYPYWTRNEYQNPALVLWNKEYTLSWQNANPEYPVLVRWLFNNDTENKFN